jgi:hypothetical protein
MRLRILKNRPEGVLPRRVATSRRGVLLLSAGVVAAYCTTSALARADGFLLIRNASNPVSAINRDDLFKLYTGQTKLFGGAVAQTVIGEQDSPEFRWLAAQFELRPKDLLTRIQQEVFKGEMKRPIVARSTADAVDAVGRSPGGVAVLSSDGRSLPGAVALLELR